MAAFVRATLVRVPAWFTVAQTLRVAELKGARHVLVEGRPSGVVSRDVLASAPAADLVLRWAHPEVPSIDAEAPVSEAHHRLAATGAPCLCVQRGGLVLGMIGLPELGAPLAHDDREAA